MGGGARPIMKGPGARRRKQRRKEGSYASSLLGDDAGILNPDSGLTLLPGSQIQQVEVLENGSTGPDGTVSNGQDCDSPKQRRSGRLAARNAINTTALALETRRDRSLDSSKAQHINCGSDQGKRKTYSGRSATRFYNTTRSSNIFPSPATSIDFSCIDFSYIPIASSTYSHYFAGDLHCHLPSVDQDIMMISTLGSYPSGPPVFDRRTFIPSSQSPLRQQPLQPSFQHPVDPRFQLPSQLPIQPPIQHSLNMNPTGRVDGGVGAAHSHQPLNRDDLVRMAFQVVPRLREKVKALENDKRAMDLEIKRLNNTNLNVANELERLRNDNALLRDDNSRTKNAHNELEKLLAILSDSGVAVPPSGRGWSQPQMQSPIQVPAGRIDPYPRRPDNNTKLLLKQVADKHQQEMAQLKEELASMRSEHDQQKAIAERADSNGNLVSKQAIDNCHQEIMQLREEMARIRSESDYHKAYAGKTMAIINNAKARAAVAKAAEATKKATSITDILSSFRVDAPRPTPQGPPTQSQAHGLTSSYPMSTARPTVSVQSIPTPQPISAAQSVSTLQPISSAQSASTAQSIQTVSTAQPAPTAQSEPAPRPTSSSSQPVTIDLTIDNPLPGRSNSCPDIGNLSASTRPGHVPASIKRKCSWLPHHPLSKEASLGGYKSFGMTHAGQIQKRDEQREKLGLSINPEGGRKRKKTASKPAKKPARQPAKKPAARQPAKKPASEKKGRPMKRQRVENDAHQMASIQERAMSETSDEDGETSDVDSEPANNHNGASTGHHVQADDGLDEEIAAALAEMSDVDSVSSDEDEEDIVPPTSQRVAPVQEREMSVTSDEDEEPCINRNTTIIRINAATNDGLDEDIDAALAEISDDESVSSDEDETIVPSTHQRIPSVLTAATINSGPSMGTSSQESDGLDDDIEAALAEMANDDKQLADTISTKCPRCDLEGGHQEGGEKCIYEDDGLDDLFGDDGLDGLFRGRCYH
ncbi:hypothetical protein MMC30_000637 [Trapelia coarctata]|nr:hypothetical protein [Trapelia coarctata]